MFSSLCFVCTLSDKIRYVLNLAFQSHFVSKFLPNLIGLLCLLFLSFISLFIIFGMFYSIFTSIKDLMQK